MTRPPNRRRTGAIVPERLRRIGPNGFAFIQNRLLHDGFFSAPPQDKSLLYVARVLAAGPKSRSCHHFDPLCALLLCWRRVECYLEARNGFIGKAPLAFNRRGFHVLELPTSAPALCRRALRSRAALKNNDGATTIRCLIEKSLQEAENASSRR